MGSNGHAHDHFCADIVFVARLGLVLYPGIRGGGGGGGGARLGRASTTVRP